jgi:hypothetical protein
MLGTVSMDKLHTLFSALVILKYILKQTKTYHRIGLPLHLGCAQGTYERGSATQHSNANYSIRPGMGWWQKGWGHTDQAVGSFTVLSAERCRVTVSARHWLLHNCGFQYMHANCKTALLTSSHTLQVSTLFTDL